MEENKEVVNEEIKEKETKPKKGIPLIFAILLFVVGLASGFGINALLNGEEKENKAPEEQEETTSENQKQDEENKKDDNDNNKNESNEVTKEDESFIKKVIDIDFRSDIVDYSIMNINWENENIQSYYVIQYTKLYHKDAFTEHTATSPDDKCMGGSGVCDVISKDDYKKYAKELLNNENCKLNKDFIVYEKDNKYYLALGGSQGIEYTEKNIETTKENSVITTKVSFKTKDKKDEVKILVYTFKYNENKELYLDSIKKA